MCAPFGGLCGGGDATMLWSERHVSSQRATAPTRTHMLVHHVRYSRKDRGHVYAGRHRSGLGGRPRTTHSHRAAFCSCSNWPRDLASTSEKAINVAMIPHAELPAGPPRVQRGGRRASDHGDSAPERRRDPLRQGPRGDRRERDAGPSRLVKQAAGLEKLNVIRGCRWHRRCCGVVVRGFHDQLRAFHRTPDMNATGPAPGTPGCPAGLPGDDDG